MVSEAKPIGFKQLKGLSKANKVIRLPLKMMLVAVLWTEGLLLLLLLLLSRFSCVQLCATHQAPSSLGFSRQEHWSGLPFPSPMHESEK